MTNSDEIGLQNISQLIGALLNHDQLMTPVLQAQFGEVAARDETRPRGTANRC